MGKLVVLMITAFIDMVGTLMIIPLLPFYAKSFGASGLTVGLLVASFAIAQLLSAPMWGRFSDRYGRRPALMVGLAASAIAYIIFAYSDSLWLLFLSRLVQGSGGGTVSVIQAYVADALKPEERAKGLGWLSAATNAGVALGPVLGSQIHGTRARTRPGFAAAVLCVMNMGFAWRYLVESRDMAEARATTHRRGRSREAVVHVITHSSEPAPRLIWIYAIGIGAFQGMNAILALFLAARFAVTSGDDRVFLHVHRHHLGPHARADSRLGGRPVWRGQAVAARAGAAGHRPGGDAVHAPYGPTPRPSPRASGVFCRSRRWRCCRFCRSRWPLLCSRSARLSHFRA